MELFNAIGKIDNYMDHEINVLNNNKRTPFKDIEYNRMIHKDTTCRYIKVLFLENKISCHPYVKTDIYINENEEREIVLTFRHLKNIMNCTKMRFVLSFRARIQYGIWNMIIKCNQIVCYNF